MKSNTVIFTEPYKAEIQEIDCPKPGKSEVLIRTEQTLISTGTELTFLTGECPEKSKWSEYIHYPQKSGYSNVGIIEEVGEGVSKDLIGKRVASFSGHSQYVIVNVNELRMINYEIKPEEATFFALAETTINGIRRTGIELGNRVVVYGAGIVGQLAARFLLAGGCTEIFVVIVYWIFISGMTIPLHATLLPLFLLFRKMHIINNPLSILIPYIVFALPTGILILTNAYASLPIEMEESACIDGCNIYQLFWKIMFPLVKPTVAAIALFTFLSSWNELMFAMTFISEPKWKTLTIGLQSLSGMFYTEWGPIGAGMVVATAPVLIIYLLLNRQVQNALIMGAVKG